MARKMSEQDLIVNTIRKLLIPFKGRTGLTVEIRESFINRCYDIVVTNGTFMRTETLHLEKSPFVSRTIKYVQKELGFSNVTQSKYGQTKVSFS